jgi:hypothetical protein
MTGVEPSGGRRTLATFVAVEAIFAVAPIEEFADPMDKGPTPAIRSSG